MANLYKDLNAFIRSNQLGDPDQLCQYICVWDSSQRPIKFSWWSFKHKMNYEYDENLLEISNDFIIRMPHSLVYRGEGKWKVIKFPKFLQNNTRRLEKSHMLKPKGSQNKENELLDYGYEFGYGCLDKKLKD